MKNQFKIILELKIHLKIQICLKWIHLIINFKKIKIHQIYLKALILLTIILVI